jgi:hypothetical protein
MRHYYRINITCCSEEDGEMTPFDQVTQTQLTIAGIHAWLIDRYPDMTPDRTGQDEDILIYRFENKDWSHFPLQTWQQVDCVHVSHIAEGDTDIDLYMPMAKRNA